jgi:type II secretory pathway component PulF
MDLLARYIDAGLALPTAARELQHSARGVTRIAWTPVLEALAQGAGVSQSVASGLHARPAAVARFRAAEKLGRLGPELRAEAVALRAAALATRKLLARLAYPLLVWFAGTVIYAVPAYALEGPAAFVIAWLGGAFGMLFWVGGGFALWLLLGRLVSRPRSAAWLASVPWAGRALLYRQRADFLETLAHTLAWGAPPADALRHAAASAASIDWQHHSERAVERLAAGQTFSDALESPSLLGADARSWIGAGERTGTLDSALRTLAESAHTRFERARASLFRVVAVGVSIAIIASIALGIVERMQQVMGGVGGGLLPSLGAENSAELDELLQELEQHVEQAPP